MSERGEHYRYRLRSHMSEGGEHYKERLKEIDIPNTLSYTTSL